MSHFIASFFIARCNNLAHLYLMGSFFDVIACIVYCCYKLLVTVKTFRTYSVLPFDQLLEQDRSVLKALAL